MLGDYGESWFVSFWWHYPIHENNVRSLVDRGGGIEDSQHCIDIILGQEERIPERKRRELKLAFGHFPIHVVMFLSMSTSLC